VASDSIATKDPTMSCHIKAQYAGSWRELASRSRSRAHREPSLKDWSLVVPGHPLNHIVQTKCSACTFWLWLEVAC